MKTTVMKIATMKTSVAVLFFFCALCATSASAQNAAVLSNNPQPMQMSDHVMHASEHSMAQESNLLSTSSYTYAQGEVPLSEVGSPPRQQVPLGDVARAYRKEHAHVPKAIIVLEKQYD
jgi:hypothetical protein